VFWCQTSDRTAFAYVGWRAVWITLDRNSVCQQLERGSMRPRSIVFDLFGDYLRYRDGAARLRTLVALLNCFGVGESTTRVVMARLRREGWFDTRTTGRETVYTLTSKSWQMLDEGRSRIFERDVRPWDGQWHMVIYSVPETDRALRDDVRKELTWLGFGPLASSTWISPRDRLSLVVERFGDHPQLRLDLLSCKSSGLPHDREMAARCWDLDTLNSDYTQFLRTYRPMLPRLRSAQLTPAEALVTRTELIHDYRKFPFRDPDLPVELLPGGWRGHEAHDMFLKGHDLLGPAADRLIDEVLAGAGESAAS
jgi:phenylacetic acid degradation operon negative regulatory protein